MLTSIPAAESLGAPLHTDTADQPSVYEPGTRLVRLDDDTMLAVVASKHGLDIEHAVGRSGFAVVSGDPASLEALTRDPRVATVGPVGIMEGAGRRSRQVLQLQWHIDMVAPASPGGAGSWTVAVLDSGIAYETAKRYGKHYTQATTLSRSPIRSPWDFVNRDAYPNDDNGHGTHIASTLASHGTVEGITPGVGLMPVKVLDEHNRGSEYGLIEGLYHAVDHGADVVNMSLSFRPGYVPSLALKEVLEYASDHGVVLVGASGNHGVEEVSWPAASPNVIAVGASQLYPDSYYGWYAGHMMRLIDYSNKSGAVDVVAPGGNLSVDRNGDGIPDGILAESIHPQDPADTGLWLMAGTSQAAAITSGLAVQLLEAGVAPQDVAPALQLDGMYGDLTYGKGGGYTFMYGAPPYWWPQHREYHATILPYLQNDRGWVRPAAKVRLFDDNGDPAPYGTFALVDVVGEDGGTTLSCQVDGLGACEVRGSAVPASQVAAWKMTVSGVTDHLGYGFYGLWDFNGVVHRPRAAATTTDALQRFIAQVEQDRGLRTSMLAWSWEQTWDVDLGAVAPGLSLVDVGGSGLASLPLGLVITQPAVDLIARRSPRTVYVDGEPVQVNLLSLTGHGLASLPLGLARFPILTIDGSGLASLPLGLTAGDLLGFGDTFVPMSGHGLASLPFGFESTPMGRKLGNGGWTTMGYGPASALASSSALPIQPALDTATPYAAALGATPYAP